MRENVVQVFEKNFMSLILTVFCAVFMANPFSSHKRSETASWSESGTPEWPGRTSFRKEFVISPEILKKTGNFA